MVSDHDVGRSFGILLMVNVNLFHKAPYPARVLAASARGAQLRRWRYSRGSEALVEEALARDRWPLERWETWQSQRVAEVLRRAATSVPYYRDHWATRDDGNPEQLRDWPLLGKEVLRQGTRRFVSEASRGRLFEDHTSGTSGTPLTVYLTRPTVRAWYALHEARTRRWHGVSRHDRWAMLGGQLVAPPVASKPPFWVWNAGLRQLYLSAYHLTPATVGAYLDAMRRHRVVHMLGYPSAMAELARLALEHGLEGPGLRVVVTNAEPLLDHQREVIGRAFGCPVRATYGMSEAVLAASECEHGRLHMWPEVGMAEALDDDGAPVPAGVPGRLAATGLLNVDTMLVRYLVGDTVTIESDDAGCPCGRSLPVLRSVEGRTDDLVTTVDGRRVGRLDPVFKSDLPIERAQIVQEARDRFVVKVVPSPAFTAADGETIADRLRARVGPVAVDIETVDDIPLDANGKFRAVISRVSP